MRAFSLAGRGGGRSGRTNDASSASGSLQEAIPPIVQYVVLRKDLTHELGWPMGSVVAQACHAALAAAWTHRQHPDTVSYCSKENLDHMRKVVLEVQGESQLIVLARKLEEAGIQHKLWIEQPENFPTCLATRPYPKPEVQAYFRGLSLCK